MKQTTLTKLLAGGAACAMALSTALAQTDSSTTTTTTSGATGTTASQTTTTSTEPVTATGTVATLTPGSDFIMLRSTPEVAPMKYYYTKTTTVVDPTGKTVEISALRPDMPISYTYTKEGDHVVITKVTLQQPLSYYEKKETTTTTTTQP